MILTDLQQSIKFHDSQVSPFYEKNPAVAMPPQAGLLIPSVSAAPSETGLPSEARMSFDHSLKEFWASVPVPLAQSPMSNPAYLG